MSVKLAGYFFLLATKSCELEPRLKVAKLFCQWLRGDRVKFVLYLSLPCEKITNKQKEAGFGPFKKAKLL